MKLKSSSFLLLVFAFFAIGFAAPINLPPTEPTGTFYAQAAVGDWAAVAWTAANPTFDTVEIYKRTSGVWASHSVLTSPVNTDTPQYIFGYTLDMDEDASGDFRLLIATKREAPDDDLLNVYVYNSGTDVWDAEPGSLTITDGVLSAEGTAKIDETHIVISVSGAANTIYTSTRTTGTWGALTALPFSVAEAQELSLYENSIVAYRALPTSDQPVHFLQNADADWTSGWYTARLLTFPGGSLGTAGTEHRCGVGLSISASHIYVGCSYGSSGNVAQDGDVHIFSHPNDDDPVFQVSLAAPNQGVNAQFGRYLSATDDLLVVSAEGEDSAYTYEKHSGNWFPGVDVTHTSGFGLRVQEAGDQFFAADSAGDTFYAASQCTVHEIFAWNQVLLPEAEPIINANFNSATEKVDIEVIVPYTNEETMWVIDFADWAGGSLDSANSCENRDAANFAVSEDLWMNAAAKATDTNALGTTSFLAYGPSAWAVSSLRCNSVRYSISLTLAELTACDGVSPAVLSTDLVYNWQMHVTLLHETATSPTHATEVLSAWQREFTINVARTIDNLVDLTEIANHPGPHEFLDVYIDDVTGFLKVALAITSPTNAVTFVGLAKTNTGYDGVDLSEESVTPNGNDYEFLFTSDPATTGFSGYYVLDFNEATVGNFQIAFELAITAQVTGSEDLELDTELFLFIDDKTTAASGPTLWTSSNRIFVKQEAETQSVGIELQEAWICYKAGGVVWDPAGGDYGCQNEADFTDEDSWLQLVSDATAETADRAEFFQVEYFDNYNSGENWGTGLAFRAQPLAIPTRNYFVHLRSLITEGNKRRSVHSVRQVVVSSPSNKLAAIIIEGQGDEPFPWDDVELEGAGSTLRPVSYLALLAVAITSTIFASLW